MRREIRVCQSRDTVPRFPSPRMTPLGSYLLSLPERVLRSASALSGGLVREIGNVTLPSALRRTKLYQTMVESTVRFLVEQVGEVNGVYPAENKLAEHFLLKRTLGDGIDMAGIVAFHASPVWVLAALADISGAGRQLIDEISSSLKEEGLLDRNARFESIDQLLDGLEHTAGQLATSIRFPPLDIAGLREEWTALKESARAIPPPSLPSPGLVRDQWEELKREAARQHRSVLELSSLMTLSAVRAVPANLLWLSRCARTATLRTGQLFADGLLNHYRATLRDIRDVGYLVYWTNEFRPYLRAAADQFSPAHQSLTERLLKKRRSLSAQTRQRT
jgi:hypothetical protein